MIAALTWISFSQIVQICVVANLEERSSAIDIATMTTSGLYKMVFYIVRQKDFQKLIDKMNIAFIEESSDKSLKMRKWLRYANSLTIFHITSAMCILSFWVFSPIINKHILDNSRTTVQSEVDHEGILNSSGSPTLFFTQSNVPGRDQSYIKSLPDKNHGQFILGSHGKSIKHNNATSIKMYEGTTVLLEEDKKRLLNFLLNCWYPFDVTKSPVYEIAYFLEFITLFGSAHVYMVSDCFFFTLIYIVCGQLEILKVSLKNLRFTVNEYTSKTLQASPITG